MVVVINDLMWSKATLNSSIKRLQSELSKYQGVAGYTDWRLPTVSELKQLLKSPRCSDFEYHIDVNLFPDVSRYEYQFYLTSTYNSSDWVQTVDFWNGDTALAHINDEKCIRLCRDLK